MALYRQCRRCNDSFDVNRLQTLEQTNASLKEEATRCRSELEAQRKEKERLKENLEESQMLIASLKEEIHMLREQEKRYKDQKNAAEQVRMSEHVPSTLPKTVAEPSKISRDSRKCYLVASKCLVNS